MASAGKTVINKTDMVPAFVEIMVQWDIMEKTHTE